MSRVLTNQNRVFGHSDVGSAEQSRAGVTNSLVVTLIGEAPQHIGDLQKLYQLVAQVG